MFSNIQGDLRTLFLSSVQLLRRQASATISYDVSLAIQAAYIPIFLLFSYHEARVSKTLKELNGDGENLLDVFFAR